MKLAEILIKQKETILNGARESLARANLTSYARSGNDINRVRFSILLDHVITGLNERNLLPLTDYIRKISLERFQAGFDFKEVQTALNVLEETLWKMITESQPPELFAESLGAIATILGTAKSTLAVTYINLVSSVKTPSLDLNAMFQGTDSSDFPDPD